MFFLKSRSAYEEVRKLLAWPSAKTLKSYFGRLGTPGSKDECKRVIKSVFDKLDGDEKHYKILVDEIHIQPTSRYSSIHDMGTAVDDPCKAARTVLAIRLPLQR